MINAYAMKAPEGKLEPYQYQARGLKPFDIDVAISHCGICYSDVHFIANDWGITPTPFVPGHEIVGHVIAKGKNVHHLKLGQRVGIGWQCSACMSCEFCDSADENLCRQQQATCVDQHGGFADRIITDSRFAFAIPDSLDSATCAPLMCGGATVFSPLFEHITHPTMKVGIIGIGGLGHLAIQFANAFGCHVTAFSSSPAKEASALEFGATRFISSNDPKALRKEAGSLDFILSTVPANLPWSSYLNILKPRGKLCFVGAIPNEISFNSSQLLYNVRKTICGSNIANRVQIQKMLAFAEQHQIQAQIEQFSFSEVNTAIQQVKSHSVNFRAVLVNPAIP